MKNDFVFQYRMGASRSMHDPDRAHSRGSAKHSCLFYQPALCRQCVFALWTSCLLANKFNSEVFLHWRLLHFEIGRKDQCNYARLLNQSADCNFHKSSSNTSSFKIRALDWLTRNGFRSAFKT